MTNTRPADPDSIAAGAGPARLLVVDCATQACSVALFGLDPVTAAPCAPALGGSWQLLGRGHAEALVPLIAELPDRGRADRIAVNTGPGSFTGIRVGLAAARALALAWQVPLDGYSSLALVAAQARARVGAVPIDVVTEAGHGEWFFQPFAADGTALAPLATLPPAAVQAALRAPVVAGSAAERAVAGSARQALALWPDARAYALLGAGMLSGKPDASVLPSYGRAPDARPLPVAS